MSHPQLVQAVPQHRVHVVEQDAGPILPQLEQLRYLVTHPQRAPVGQGAAIEVQPLTS